VPYLLRPYNGRMDEDKLYRRLMWRSVALGVFTLLGIAGVQFLSPVLIGSADELPAIVVSQVVIGGLAGAGLWKLIDRFEPF
jgi:hypothetical protein